jgi:hypothetical protein
MLIAGAASNAANIAAANQMRAAARRRKAAVIKLRKRKGYIGMKREDIDKFAGRKVYIRCLTEYGNAHGTLTQITDSTAIVLDKKGKQKVVALDFIVSIDVED